MAQAFKRFVPLADRRETRREPRSLEKLGKLGDLDLGLVETWEVSWLESWFMSFEHDVNRAFYAMFEKQEGNHCGEVDLQVFSGLQSIERKMMAFLPIG